MLAAYDRSFDALAELGVEFVEVAFPARFTELGAINGRIVSAEAYAVLAALVDDNAQRLDQDVRPRVCAGASISSRDYLVGLGRAGADEGFVHCCHRRCRRAADADRGDTRTAGSFHRSETRHPRCSRAGSTSSTCVRRRRRMVSLRVDCPPHCRSFAEPMALRIGHAYQAAHDWAPTGTADGCIGVVGCVASIRCWPVREPFSHAMHGRRNT